jgi:D-alanyl-D-alanine dipeptidase
MSFCRVIQLLKWNIVIALGLSNAHAQDSAYNKYHLKTVDSATYVQQMNDSPVYELVNLATYVPSIVADVRYATTNNFMQRRMYPEAVLYLRKPAADSLRVIQQQLNRMGYGLKIFDAYRPYDVTVQFYEQYRDTTFVASPYTGSRHNRGCAVDVTLIQLKTGKELEMPTPYDDFTDEAHALSKNTNARAIRNRKVLQKVMTQHGFDIFEAEWWHFDFRGWNRFPVMNVRFSQLKKHEPK